MAFSARVSSPAISTINVTPLVDVLLVLLIIFMITAPVITHKIRTDLPQPGRTVDRDTIDPIRLSIQTDGSMTWNDAPITDAQLNAQLSLAASRSQQPELRIDAADGAQYQAVAHVLSQAKSQGLARIDFVGH
jgi:biopolymer transport protein ExbD